MPALIAILFGGAPVDIVLVLLASYLVGSVPFGFIAGKLRGIDIRDHGSGNIGATNVLRTLGKPVGITVFVLDVLKGMLPVLTVTWLLSDSPTPVFDSIVRITAAVGAILGHNFPAWLRFKGGKGIATSAGALLPILPVPLLAALGVWIAVFLKSRYVSLASLVAALAIPVTLAILSLLRHDWNFFLIGFAILLCALAFWRHRANIARLRAGTENRFERKSGNGASTPNSAP